MSKLRMIRLPLFTRLKRSAARDHQDEGGAIIVFALIIFVLMLEVASVLDVSTWLRLRV